MEGVPKPVSLTREELFRQVWETPISRLASTYGITGNGLAKICDRLTVPYPPRGYWAKKAAGKKVVQCRLPPPGAGTPASATIRPTPRASEPKPLAPEQQERVVLIEKDTAIAVPERLTRPHAVIAEWITEHERRRREAKRDLNAWATAFAEWADIDHRRHRSLDTLFKAAERHGLAVKRGDQRETYFAFGRERIDYKLREKQKQVRRPKTASEMRWAIAGDRTWMQVLEPTGFLVFTIDTYVSDGAIRREWLETETKRLEEQLPEIVRSLAQRWSSSVRKGKRPSADARKPSAFGKWRPNAGRRIATNGAAFVSSYSGGKMRNEHDNSSRCSKSKNTTHNR